MSRQRFLCAPVPGYISRTPEVKDKPRGKKKIKRERRRKKRKRKKKKENKKGKKRKVLRLACEEGNGKDL
jgi:hypothetical protein